jgi:crotonobetainyl-CoA:carnitine CoA-transferase CaiB-like acyl-CoA transferase
MAQALKNIRIVDFTSHLAGPFCTMLLADMGADVIKVERPGIGDESRKSAPFQGGMGAFFMQANRNKRSMVLDLRTPEGLDACKRLIATADVVVENYKPGTMERLGLGYAQLKKRHPRLVYTAISGYGQTGPMRENGGFDLMAQAMSGLMSICGPEAGEPHRLPIPISDLAGGMYGALGTLNALFARERTGKGQMVDASLFESALSFCPYEVAGHFNTGKRPTRIGQKHRNAAPYQIFATAEGYLVLGAATQSLWETFCKKVIRAPELLADARFATNAKRIENNDALVEIVTRHLTAKPATEWLAMLKDAAIPAAPVLSHDEVLAHPHVVARGLIQAVNHPVAGATRLMHTPLKFSATPVSIRRPAPSLGEHTAALLGELAPKAKKTSRARKAAKKPARAKPKRRR